jgi:hypothetical protein
MPDGWTLTDSEAEDVEKFESIIASSLEDKQHAVLVAAVTHNGERDWIFYCHNSDETHKRLNIVLQNENPVPIKILSYADPNWNEYKGILSNIAQMVAAH